MWWLVACVRRAPFTLGLFLLTVSVAVATHTLWDPLVNRPWLDSVSYGLPALQSGRWWTILVGAPFAMHPIQYVPTLLGLLLLGGFAEWRLGSRLTAALVVGSHVLAVVASIGFLHATRNRGWDWATGLSRLTDTGLSAGFLGAAAAASATLAPPWRPRARTALLGYVLVSLLYVGSISDLEHTFAVLAGLWVGPLVLGRRPRLELHTLTRLGYRKLAAGFLVLSGLGAVLDWLTPASGPLTSTLAQGIGLEPAQLSQTIPVVAAVELLVFGWLAHDIFRGRRRAWGWALAATVVLLGVLAVRAVGLANAHRPGWPALTYQMTFNLLGLWVLVAGRHAFANPSPRQARRGTTGSLLGVPNRAQQETARHLLEREGTVNRLAWMTTWSENRWFAPREGGGYIAYRVHLGVALGLCDPVAAGEVQRLALLQEFADAAHRDGLTRASSP